MLVFVTKVVLEGVVITEAEVTTGAEVATGADGNVPSHSMQYSFPSSSFEQSTLSPRAQSRDMVA